MDWLSSTNSDLKSTQTMDVQGGNTKTYQYDDQVTSIVMETGERTGTINAHIYEGYDYSDSGVTQEVNFDF
ncbi:MAG: hypothetical protein HC768_23855 [Acaryochloris sp. CRU_2_0]|nr:hypothetical protein [Acaryochloris sp. CRU_2_0]